MKKLIVALATFLALSAPAHAQTVIQPGQSWDAAYEAAEFGDTILLADGHHGDQTILSTKGNRDGMNAYITFEPAPGATVTLDDLDLYAPHIRVRGVDTIGLSIDGYGTRYGGDILFEDSRFRSGDLTSAWNVTYSDVEVGPNTEGVSSKYPWPQDTLIVNAWPTWDGHHPKNILFERVWFHDVYRPTSDAHSDCLQFTAGENIVIRDSWFERCQDADVMIAPDQGPILDFLIEGNWFDKTLAHYSINATNKTKGPEQWNRLTIRGNTELQGTRLDAPGITFTGNKRESMSSNMCSAAASAGSVIDGNFYRSGDPCGPNDTIDPLLDLSLEAWMAGDDPGPAPDPEPEPEPEPYEPACAPTCDEQIAALTAAMDTLIAERDELLVRVAGLEAELDAYAEFKSGFLAWLSAAPTPPE